MEYDVIVVGGGASGLFLAAHTAAGGKRTLVLEKRERPARKLLITGKGRCNLCNDCDRDAFLQNCIRGGRFLYSAIAAFTPQDTMAYFEGLGVPLVTERGQRVFPASQRAMDVVDALVRAVKDAGAQIRCATVAEVLCEEGRVRGVRTAAGERYYADNIVIATGGMSYPATGSSGDGYRFARALGHTVAPPAPALAPLDTKEPWVRELAGLSLRNVTLSLWDQKKPKKPVFQELGELLFTHTGLSGPLVLTACSLLDPARASDFSVAIDLKPGLDRAALDRRLLRDFEERQNRDFCNALDALLPRSLIPVIVRLSGIPPETKVHSLTRTQREALIGLVKGLTLHIKAPGPLEEAIITRGGVKLSEIAPSTMRSKLAEGLYFTGEVIDADALTGGFNLQIAFSTAYLAAQDILGA